MSEAVVELASKLHEVGTLALEGASEDGPVSISDDYDENARRIFLPTINLFLAGTDPSSTAATDALSSLAQFEKLAYMQYLVMAFAHFDAFFSDSLRAICESQPNVLRRDFKISWQDVLDTRTWDQLIDRLGEEYILVLGVRTAKERIGLLEREHKLNLGLPEKLLDEIEYGELVRNAIVHNAGRASDVFLRRLRSLTREPLLRLGESIPIKLGFVEGIAGAMRVTGGAILCIGCYKVFGRSYARVSSSVESKRLIALNDRLI